jgi:leucyl-tRNA synthetase
MLVDWASIEKKWQGRWEEAGIFKTDPKPEVKKFYITVPYPYPNSPQHIGHGRTYTLTDVHARYLRMRGYNVLFPMAFHYTGTPVLAMTKRLKEGDKDLIDTFLNVWKIPKEDLPKLEEPLGMANYFHRELKEGMKRMGFSIDWRREFTTIDPYYHKFIEWQFHRLRRGGFITQGSHPVGWCPGCGNPVGQHDTKGDVEPEIEEFTLIKFEHEGSILPAATLRPETVFGVTNMWLNPTVEYVYAKVDGEPWIVSQRSVEKLRLLGRKVEVDEVFKGEKLIGKKVRNPVTGNDMLILPASFVDPGNATGVVMSVPGHAPYDYVALENLKRDAFLRGFGLRHDEIRAINPISLIEVPGYSEWPAVEEVKKRGIIEQTDSRLEEATKEIYSHEFHSGRMKPNTGQYAGLPVQRARDYVKSDLLKEGKASTMYELANRPVYCRCGSECVVKMVENQWFINYGDPKWKRLAHENLDEMEIVPKDLRTEFDYVIDWLKEKACARNAGLGTQLPWDKSWIIESLSDSTIYMAFYTIVEELNRTGVDAEKLSDSFFSYVFLGSGSVKEVAEKTGLNMEDVKRMREEFSYFYPLDSRHSGRDLIPNHLTFMLFNHTAIFPKKHWPRQIVVNGSVLMEGEKMSKSLMNIIPLREALERFGTDPLRLSLMAAAEVLKDGDFSPALAKSTVESLERFHQSAMEIAGKGEGGAGGPLEEVDQWMLSRLQGNVWEATAAMEELMVRRAIHAIFYNLNQDLQWYLRRVAGERSNRERGETVQWVLRRVLDAQIRMLAPFTPHLCEEIWEAMGNDGFISLASWPEFHVEEVHPDVEELESVISGCLEDVSNILKVTGIKAGRVYFYTAADWKWKIYQNALALSKAGSLDIGALIRESLKDEALKKMPEAVAAFAREIVEDVRKLPEGSLDRRLSMGRIGELELLRKAVSFFEKEVDAQVLVQGEGHPEIQDPEGRAKRAKPYKPAIYIESLVIAVRNM